MAFSCRERAGGSLQKANDLAREAVSCNAVFGDPVAVARVASRMRRLHPHGTTRSITGRNRNHAQHTITAPTTGAPHNGLPDHARQNELPAERASVPLRYNERWRDGAGRTGVEEA